MRLHLGFQTLYLYHMFVMKTAHFPLANSPRFAPITPYIYVLHLLSFLYKI